MHSHILGKCCTRLVERFLSTSSVMLAMPSIIIRSSQCSQRGETEKCSSTSLLSHSPAFPTHRQYGFRVQRGQDHQLCGEFLDHLLHDGNSCGTGDKSNNMNIALVDPAVTEALLNRTHGISEIVHVQLLKLCFRQQEKSMPSNRESISWADTYQILFASMNSVVTSAVFKPINKGVTSKNSRFCICEDPLPVRVAACTAVHCREVPARRRHFPLEPIQASDRRTR